MYAIVDIAGKQYKIEKGQEIYVNRLEGEKGDMVNFSDVLLIDNDGKIKVGKPFISGMEVSAEILEHLKGDKIIVFKKKRRKGYQKSNGYRDYLTKIKVNSIATARKKTKTTEKATVEKVEQPKVAKTMDKSTTAKKVEPETKIKKSKTTKPKAATAKVEPITTKTKKTITTKPKVATTKAETKTSKTKKPETKSTPKKLKVAAKKVEASTTKKVEASTTKKVEASTTKTSKDTKETISSASKKVKDVKKEKTEKK